MNISPDKLKEFTVLFEEFINSYPNTAKGIKHISFYSQQRESGRRNYQAILEAKEAGEDITERVLLQLLPYRDTKNNREQGAWIHIAPAISKDLKVWFENIRWAKPEDWYKVAELIFDFINYSVEETETLSVNCHDFHRSTYSKGLQTGFMTPILNALKPDSFILINNKSRVVINHFADTDYRHKLIDYPAINKLARQLIKDLSFIIDRFDLPALRQDDLFDMFCHWLVADKKYNFKSGSVEGDYVNKYSEEESKFEEENIMLKVNPDSYFSTNTLGIIDFTNNNKLEEIDLIKYQDCYLKLFSKIAHAIDNNIFTHIKQKTNSVNGFFNHYIYGEQGYIYSEFCFNTCDTEIIFSIYLCSYFFDFCITIEADKNNALFINKFTDSLILLDKQYRYLSFEYSNKLIGEFVNIARKSIDHKNNDTLIIKTISLFVEGFLDYTDTNDSFLLTLGLRFKLQEVYEKSVKKLVDAVVETLNYLYPIILVAVSDNPEKEIEEHLKIWNPRYKLEKYVDATYIEESQLKTWIKSITRKKQAIFYGSPGTGKTFIAENIAQYLISGGDGFYELIQFHPAYSYEDFIQGIRPQTDSGQLLYNLVPGRFLEFCRQAAACKDKCVLIIDEINRANLAEVFGELMYLLEYREQEICLAGSQEKFKIPDNVYLIGTMNTADRSIALVDFALRRRFAFIKIAPNYDIITKFHQQHTHLEVTGLITVLREINNLIEDENYYLGISFFLIETLTEDLENIWQMEIEPYLEEYFCNSIEQIIDYRWEKIKDRILPLKKTNT